MNSIWIALLHMKRTIGNKKGFVTLLIIPVIVISAVIALFGRSSDDPATIAVTIADTGAYGSKLAEALKDEPLFTLAEKPGLGSEALRELVSEGRADAAVLVPEGYSDGLLAGKAPAVEMYRKTEQLWNASLKLKLEAETRRMESMASAALQSADTSGADPRATFEQLLRASDAAAVRMESVHTVRGASESFILVIGLMLMFMMFLANQTVYGVLEDRMNRTMDRMYAAPMKAWQIALGNFLGSVMLGLLQLTCILALVRLILGYDFGIPFGEMLLVLICYLLTVVGLASAVAGIVHSAAQLSQINILVVVPSCMLGGCFWPVSYMPDFMQRLANFTPQRWAIRALEELSVGAAVSEVALHLAILLLLAALLLASGAYVLRPSGSGS